MFLFQTHINRDTDDEILMSQVIKGHRKAFEYLYDRYFEKLVWYVFGFVKEMTIAEDIVQEVFMKLIDAPEKFDASRKFSTWIYTLCANRAKNYLRDDKRYQQNLTQHAAASFGASASQQHQMDARLLTERIAKLVDSLSEKEKSIYTLRFQLRYSIRETAAKMNIPEGSVKSGIYYLLKKFAHNLNYQIHEN